MREESRRGWIGARLERVEAPRFLTGTGRYLDDLEPAGTLHVKFVRSPVAHGRIQAIHVGRFLPLAPGSAMVSGQELPAHLGIRADVSQPSWQASVQPLLARDRVRFVGEPVVAVLHRDPYVAEDAAEAVEVEYEELEPVVDLKMALDPGAPRVHEGWKDNVFIRRRRSYGDVHAARRRADLVVRRLFRTHRQAAIPLEGRGCLALPEPGAAGVTLWSSTQMPHLVRTYVAAQLGLPEARVRVVAPDVGGGFGAKGHVFAEEVLVCWLALELAAPVKWVEDRREHLLASIHARDHLHLVQAYVTSDGRVEGVRAQLVVDAGAYSVFPWTAGSDSGMAAKVLPGPYTIAHYEVEDLAVATNKCPLGTYRGVGRPSAVFTMERLMDEIARELSLDPLEVRRRNLITTFPYTTAVGLSYDSGSYRDSLELAGRMVDVEGLRRQQREQAGCAVARGVGFALYNEQTAHGTEDLAVRGTPIETGYESVVVHIEPDGSVVVGTGLQSHGQALETTLAQIVAHELGVEPGQVRVVHGDTAASPYCVGTWGSRAATLGGGATARACRALREKIQQIVSCKWGVPPSQLLFEGGRVGVRGDPGRSISLREVAYWANRDTVKLPPGTAPGLEAVVFLDGPPQGTFSNACHAAVVEVDRRTGAVTILRYVVVEDCGTMINPTVVEGQVYGGVAQGIGSALLEEFLYSPDGQPLSSSFADYYLPSSVEVPLVDIRHLETPSPLTEYGMKGVGEAGAIGPAAAIANAVSDALGQGIQEVPMRMERVWRVARGERSPGLDWETWASCPALAPFWSTGAGLSRSTPQRGLSPSASGRR